MIPVFDSDAGTIITTVYYDKTYKINANLNRVSGWIDERESVAQAVYLILNIERYKFPIYSWDYGVELVNLIGKDLDTIITFLPGRVREALIQDNRIEDVTDFEYERDGKKLTVTFTVKTIFGDLPTQMEVRL